MTDLFIKRSQIALYSKESNPSLISLNNQIKTTRSILYENVVNTINSNNVAMEEIKKRMAGINAHINTLPATQRTLFGIERKFKLIDATYIFLLQKRSEAQITRAANTPDNEIIDQAPNAGFSVVFPKKSLNYTIALLIGLLLPILFILGKDYFNNTVSTREEIEKVTRLPFLCLLYTSPSPRD